MQLAWAGSSLNEKLILKKRAILGLDDGDDKAVTILNRLVTWVCLSGSRNQMEIVHKSLSQAHCLTCVMSHQFCYSFLSLFFVWSHVLTNLLLFSVPCSQF